MEGKRRDEEDMQDRLVVGEGIMVNFPLSVHPKDQHLFMGCQSKTHFVEITKKNTCSIYLGFPLFCRFQKTRTGLSGTLKITVGACFFPNKLPV